MINPKSQLTYFDPLTRQNEVYNVIYVKETTRVSEESITNTHQYWVRDGAPLDDDNEYLEPISDPDYNIRSDYAVYRQKYGFTSPEQIKAQREAIGLTLRETAMVLGMSFATLSMIETGQHLQSYTQQLKFNYLMQPQLLKSLVDAHEALIQSRLSSHDLDAEKVLQAIQAYLRAQNL